MLSMMNLDSTVWIVAGNAERLGEYEGRSAMLKSCVALIKEKDFYKAILFEYFAVKNCSFKQSSSYA